MVKMIIELNEKQHKILKTNAADNYRSAAKELKLMLEKAFGTTRYDDASNKYNPNGCLRITERGLEPTDIIAEPQPVNKFFVDKDGTFDVLAFTINGIEQLINENYYTKQAYYKAFKEKAIELNVLQPSVDELNGWRNGSNRDFIIDEMIKFLNN